MKFHAEWRPLPIFRLCGSVDATTYELQTHPNKPKFERITPKIIQVGYYFCRTHLLETKLKFINCVWRKKFAFFCSTKNGTTEKVSDAIKCEQFYLIYVEHWLLSAVEISHYIQFLKRSFHALARIRLIWLRQMGNICELVDPEPIVVYVRKSAKKRIELKKKSSIVSFSTVCLLDSLSDSYLSIHFTSFMHVPCDR